MKRKGFIKSLGLVPFIPFIPFAIKKNRKVDEAIDDIKKGINPKENIRFFNFIINNRSMEEQLAKNAHNTLEKIASSVKNEKMITITAYEVK